MACSIVVSAERVVKIAIKNEGFVRFSNVTLTFPVMLGGTKMSINGQKKAS